MTFAGAVRSEFLKFFSTRMWWGMALAVAAGAAAFAILFGIVLTLDVDPATAEAQGIPSGDPTQVANSVYTGGVGLGYLLMLTIGVLQIGSEYRHRTITSTFLAVPDRWRAMLAKVLALVGIGAGYGLLSLAVSVAFGATILRFRGADAFPSTDVLRSLALALLVLALWTLVGLGLGILIPNQVAALLIGVGVAWIVEPLLGVVLRVWDFTSENVAPYLPTAATNAVLDAVQSPGEVRLEWWAAALVLGAWAALLAGAGILRAVRQDVS
jgi:ABC-2 type transport system permease protein